uniref:Uncharacterized protein n=1 Tax=Ustilaginoidea virens mycovirus TaxID=1318463 RepID=M9TJ74_9VIRU|nr:hypothetical protein [Ustilaginoidea virens mycovirus]
MSEHPTTSRSANISCVLLWLTVCLRRATSACSKDNPLACGKLAFQDRTLC